MKGNKSEYDEMLRAELIRLNGKNRKTFKTVYVEGDEIRELWNLDFAVGDMLTKIHTPEKGQFTAYCLTRCTATEFFLHKISIRYWWVDTTVNGEKVSVRSSGIVYEDTPADILTAQKVLYLDGWKSKSSAEWGYIFDELIRYIKLAPSDIRGKTLPDLKKFVKTI